MKNYYVKPGTPVHFYSKALFGQGIFYNTEDLIVHYSICSVLFRKNGLKVMAYVPMFNHLHSIQYVDDIKTSLKVISNTEHIFTAEYNRHYGISGKMMKSPVGWAPKGYGKNAKSSIIYVYNNPVAGKLHKSALEYKWTTLAYYNSPHPFSSAIIFSKASRRLRRSVSLVKYAFNNNQYLNYSLLESILDGLHSVERAQVIDFIIDTYRFVDFELLCSFFGNFQTTMTAIESGAGAEHDLKEDFEDYSYYRKMIMFMRDMGYQVDRRQIEELTPEEKMSIRMAFLYRFGYNRKKMIDKFLHLVSIGGEAVP